VPWEVGTVHPSGVDRGIELLLVDKADAHLCGEECAMKYVSKHLFCAETREGK
jgi:hypothetical protein